MLLQISISQTLGLVCIDLDGSLIIFRRQSQVHLKNLGCKNEESPVNPSIYVFGKWIQMIQDIENGSIKLYIQNMNKGMCLKIEDLWT